MQARWRRLCQAICFNTECARVLAIALGVFATCALCVFWFRSCQRLPFLTANATDSGILWMLLQCFALATAGCVWNCVADWIQHLAHVRQDAPETTCMRACATFEPAQLLLNFLLLSCVLVFVCVFIVSGIVINSDILERFTTVPAKYGWLAFLVEWSLCCVVFPFCICAARESCRVARNENDRYDIEAQSAIDKRER